MAVVILLICFLTIGTLFFSVNAQALLIFSRVKLQDAFREINKEDLSEALVENAEKLSLSCSLYRIVLNMGILFSLLVLFAAVRKDALLFTDYVLAFIIRHNQRLLSAPFVIRILSDKSW